VAVEKLKRYTTPGTDEILAKLRQAGNSAVVSVAHKVIKYISNKEELPQH
jgi:hypothetical protein